jgi:hypothetical protein
MSFLNPIKNFFLKLQSKKDLVLDKQSAQALLEKNFSDRKITEVDILEHLETLRAYASKSDHITELGVRKIVSTWAFMMGHPKRLVSVDIVSPTYYLRDHGRLLRITENICKELNIDFTFVLGDTLKIDIEDTDLLFIDTLHTYSQLIQELNRHGNKSRKWIILHDTESCKDYFTNSIGVVEGGLKDAVDEFLQNNPHWFTKEVFTNNNGLTVLERK